MAKKNLFKAQYGLTESEAKAYIARLLDERWTYSSVRNAYGKPSARKVAIEERIIHDGLAKNMETSSYRVISRNGWHFSCGYFFNTESGKMVHIETPSHTYEFPFIVEE